MKSNDEWAAYDPPQLINIVARNPPIDICGNIQKSRQRKLLELAPFLGGTFETPAAVVAGGPSLNLDEVREFPGIIFASGSVHDHLLANDIVPHCSVLYDPWSDMAKAIKQPHDKIIYLVASHCAPETFDLLQGKQVYCWHGLCGDPDSDRIIMEELGDVFAVPGGPAVTLKAWVLALALGHRDIHFFGYDCSFPEGCESQHAYTVPKVQCEEPVGITVLETGKRFLSNAGFVRQAQFFVDTYKALAPHKITVHGEGLIADLLKVSQMTSKAA